MGKSNELLTTVGKKQLLRARGRGEAEEEGAQKVRNADTDHKQYRHPRNDRLVSIPNQDDGSQSGDDQVTDAGRVRKDARHVVP